jgi:hypothetical protein
MGSPDGKPPAATPDWIPACRTTFSMEKCCNWEMRTMSDTSDIGQRLIKLEIDQGVREKTFVLEDRVRDLEAMVKTARYLLAVVGVLVTLIGAGITAYVSSLTSKFDEARQLLDTSSKAIKKAEDSTQRATDSAQKTDERITLVRNDSEKLLAQIKDAHVQSDELRNNLRNLTDQAADTLRASARDEVQKAIEVLLLPVQSRISADFREALDTEFRKIQDQIDRMSRWDPIVSATGFDINCDYRIKILNTTSDFKQSPEYLPATLVMANQLGTYSWEGKDGKSFGLWVIIDNNKLVSAYTITGAGVPSEVFKRCPK